MRTRLIVAALLVACGSPSSSSPSSPGVFGAPLTTTLHVLVLDEDDGLAPLVGAHVDVGGTPVTTDANGEAQLATSASVVTLTVRAAGHESERWIGVDRERAIVAIGAPRAPSTIDGAISGLSTSALVSATTAVSLLRPNAPLPSGASATQCGPGPCEAVLTVQREPSLDPLDVVIMSTNGARLTSAVSVGPEGHFALDASSGTSLPLVTLSPTLPSMAGFASVVGVPGLSSSHGVALFPGPAAIGVLAPSGGSIGDRLWYVASASTTDGSGESLVLDRNVGADGAVHLPSAFLPVPVVTVSSGATITVDVNASLYAIHTSSSAGSMRILVLRPSGAQTTLPIVWEGPGTLVVRAVDAGASTDGTIDLAAIEASVTRVATRTL